MFCIEFFIGYCFGFCIGFCLNFQPGPSLEISLRFFYIKLKNQMQSLTDLLSDYALCQNPCANLLCSVSVLRLESVRMLSSLGLIAPTSLECKFEIIVRKFRDADPNKRKFKIENGGSK